MNPPQRGETEMITMQTRMDARREQMLRELASDLADLVRSGDMTPEEANDWLAAKADQWAKE
jgi:hypothetical protein